MAEEDLSPAVVVVVVAIVDADDSGENLVMRWELEDLPLHPLQVLEWLAAVHIQGQFVQVHSADLVD